MQLHERLMDLIGHEVTVSTRLEGEAGSVGGGVVKEVGPDFLIVGDRGGRSDSWIRMAAVVTVIHSSDCPRCAGGSASQLPATDALPPSV